jgi:hypothetical protein
MAVLFVLRLLAVYFGTALVLLLLVNRFVRRVPILPAVFLVLGPFVLTGRAMLTAGVYAPLDISYSGLPLESLRTASGLGPETRTPLLSDVIHSYIPSRKAVREAVKSGRLPLWNRFSMAGEPLLAFQQPAAFHPGTWIGFLLPLAQAWTFEMSLRLLIALLSAYLFFREIGCGQGASLFGAVGWALSDHLVFFLGYSVTASLAPFPLLLLGLYRLSRAGGQPSGFGIMVAALVLIGLGGHPETLLHTVAAGGVYFLFDLSRRAARRRTALLLALGAGALAFALLAVVLLPFLEVMPHTSAHAARSGGYSMARKSVDWNESLHRSLRTVLPYAYGVSGRGATAFGYGLPGAYAGALLIPLAVAGLFSRRREKWVFLLLATLGVTVGVRLVGISDWIGRLPLFRISVNEYLIFLGVFGTVGLAVLGLEWAKQSSRTRALAILAIAAAAVLTLSFVRVYPQLRELQMSASYLRWRLLLQVGPLLLAAAWLWPRPRTERLPLLTAGLLALLVLERALEAGEVYPTFSARAFYPEPPLLRSIPRGLPARIAALGFTLIPDSSTLYELEDVRGYEALHLSALVETYPLWCVEQPVWFNRIDDPARPFLSFLNVRYVIAGPSFPMPEGWILRAADSSGKVFENPRAVARAFVPGHVAYIREPSKQLEQLARIEDFSDFGIVQREAAPSRDSEVWIPNGAASVTIHNYEGQALTLDVDARAPVVVGTSIPRWPGWKALLDGRSVPSLSFNRAFLGFRVPAGRHTLHLRYWPDGFRDGLRISAAAFGVVLLLIWRMSRRTKA